MEIVDFDVEIMVWSVMSFVFGLAICYEWLDTSGKIRK